jgi:metal-responsive CopG/Arc/MetJ family transcriptional regulator
MTMLSFRVEEIDARAAQSWAERLGVDRSELLRDALRRHLLRLASEVDAETWRQHPLTVDESSLTAIEDWGPA